MAAMAETSPDHRAATHDPTPPTPTSDASERDATLLLDMKEPVAGVNDDPREPESETEPSSVQAPPPVDSRSILNAASDSSDGEDAAAVRDGRGGDALVVQKPVADDEEEDVLPPVHGEKGVEYSLSELFVNPNLRLKSANVVLKKDPFAIPRATDNVTEYRPRFNPLNILMSEEKLLPRNFTFDFSEGIPGEPKHQGGKGKTLGKRGGKDLQGRASRSNSDFDPSSLLVRKSAPPPVRNPQVFGDKLATMGLLMGSMPRQPQASPKPLINTPTVHNPFGEPLLELVVNTDPPAVSSDTIAMQRLRAATAPPESGPSHSFADDSLESSYVPPPSASTQAPLQETLSAEFDVFGVDMHNISNLSKLSIAANNVAAADSTGSFHGATYATAPPPPVTPSTPVLYDGLANYLPNHFAENRVSQHMVLDPALYDVPAFHGEPTVHADGQYHSQQQEIQRHSAYEANYSAPSVAPASVPAPSSHHQSHHQQQQPQPSDSLQPVAKKPRSKNVFRPCTHPGCTKGARGKSGLCQKHGGGKRCATPNCPKGAQGSSKFCLFHGGGYRCTVPGCATGARGTSGLCAKHGGYKRAREGGIGSGNDEAEDELRGGPADKKPRMEMYEGRALEASG